MVEFFLCHIDGSELSTSPFGFLLFEASLNGCRTDRSRVTFRSQGTGIRWSRGAAWKVWLRFWQVWTGGRWLNHTFSVAIGSPSRGHSIYCLSCVHWPMGIAINSLSEWGRVAEGQTRLPASTAAHRGSIQSTTGCVSLTHATRGTQRCPGSSQR